MTAQTFEVQWKRLKAQFRLDPERDAAVVQREWFSAVQHYHEDALEAGVTAVIRDAKDTFWPPLGVLLERIQSRFDRYDRHKQGCQTCDGSTWIEAWPVIWDHKLYEMMARCPDCGVPAPPMKKPHPRARPATKAEYDDWKERKAMRDTMPVWAKAKKPYNPEKVAERLLEMRELFDRLRMKIFAQREPGEEG